MPKPTQSRKEKTEQTRTSKADGIDVQGIIQSQLDQFYASIANERSNRVKVRNWQVTVLVVFVGYLLSDKVIEHFATVRASFLLLFSVVVVFWLIEAFHQSLVLALLSRAGKLEDLLVGRGNVPQRPPRDLFYVNGWHTVSTSLKLKYFIWAFFRCKSIVLFNLLLIAASLILVMVRFHVLLEPAID